MFKQPVWPCLLQIRAYHYLQSPTPILNENQHMKNKSISLCGTGGCLSHWPAQQACEPTGRRQNYDVLARLSSGFTVVTREWDREPFQSACCQMDNLAETADCQITCTKSSSVPNQLMATWWDCGNNIHCWNGLNGLKHKREMLLRSLRKWIFRCRKIPNAIEPMDHPW